MKTSPHKALLPLILLFAACSANNDTSLPVVTVPHNSIFFRFISVPEVAGALAGDTVRFSVLASTEDSTVTQTASGPGSVKWESSAPAIASIDQHGLVTGHAAGITTLRAIMYADTGPLCLHGVRTGRDRPHHHALADRRRTRRPSYLRRPALGQRRFAAERLPQPAIHVIGSGRRGGAVQSGESRQRRRHADIRQRSWHHDGHRHRARRACLGEHHHHRAVAAVPHRGVGWRRWPSQLHMRTHDDRPGVLLGHRPEQPGFRHVRTRRR